MEGKIVIIVQARMTSTRLPGKVMLPILGKSLLARMIERLQMINYPATLVVATSENEQDYVIINEAKALGVVWFRGSEQNLLERHYQAAKSLNADFVVKIPSDCPLIDPLAVDRVLDHFFKSGQEFDYVSNLHPATWPDGNDVEIMTMRCLTETYNNATRDFELEHTTPYIWENPDKFIIGNVAWETGKDYSMSHRFTIDYREDYHFIKAVFEQLYPQKNNFSCNDILNLLAERPDVMAVNAAHAGVNWYRHHLDDLRMVDANQTKFQSYTEL